MKDSKRKKGNITAEYVYKLTAQIPRGRVSTYGAIAGALNAGHGSRAIGQILKRNPTPIVVPCHRVVKSNGELGGYGGAGGLGKKARLLRDEGIVVEDNTVSDLDRVLFTNFRPLEEDPEKIAFRESSSRIAPSQMASNHRSSDPRRGISQAAASRRQ